MVNKKHEIGVILRDKRYTRLLKVIYLGYSKPSDILKELEIEESNLYPSKLSNRIANILGRYYKFIISNGETKKDLIRYRINYAGIVEFLFKKFLLTYQDSYSKKVQNQLLSFVNFDCQDIRIMLDIFFKEYLLVKKYDDSLYKLFKAFLVEVYRSNNEFRVQFNSYLKKFTPEQRDLVDKKSDYLLRLNFHTLENNKQIDLITYSMFSMLSYSYVDETILKS